MERPPPFSLGEEDGEVDGNAATPRGSSTRRSASTAPRARPATRMSVSRSETPPQSNSRAASRTQRPDFDLSIVGVQRGPVWRDEEHERKEQRRRERKKEMEALAKAPWLKRERSAATMRMTPSPTPPSRSRSSFSSRPTSRLSPAMAASPNGWADMLRGSDARGVRRAQTARYRETPRSHRLSPGTKMDDADDSFWDGDVQWTPRAHTSAGHYQAVASPEPYALTRQEEYERQSEEDYRRYVLNDAIVPVMPERHRASVLSASTADFYRGQQLEAKIASQQTRLGKRSVLARMERQAARERAVQTSLQAEAISEWEHMRAVVEQEEAEQRELERLRAEELELEKRLRAERAERMAQERLARLKTALEQEQAELEERHRRRQALAAGEREARREVDGESDYEMPPSALHRRKYVIPEPEMRYWTHLRADRANDEAKRMRMRGGPL